MTHLVGPLSSSPVVSRYPENPILSREHMPYPADLVYNCGVVKYQGRYVMLFRVDAGWDPELPWHKFHDIHLGLAYSADGIHWEVDPRPILEGLKSPENIWAYDPRLTVLDGRCLVSFCLDTRHGMRAGLAVTDDFEQFDLLSLSLPDLRNVVVFPGRAGGKYVRLERPFPIYLRRNWGEIDRFDIWLSDSPDLRYWGGTQLLLAVEQVPFANEKLGPGAPPILTPQGWLTIFHAVDSDPARGKNGWEDRWIKRYTAGIMLLDLEDPRKVRGMSLMPLLAPEAPYETETGFRNGVVFPTAAVLEEDGEVKIYYGAADTVICLATARIEDLVGLCTDPVPPLPRGNVRRPG